MQTPWDGFMDAIEQRKRQLDEVIEAYNQFRKKLDALPPEIAREAEAALSSITPVSEQSVAKSPDLADKTALECTAIILKEHGNAPLHFSQIAKEALARGYKGRSSGTPEEIEARTIQSFWAAMSRSPEFQSIKRGRYQLREEAGPEQAGN